MALILSPGVIEIAVVQVYAGRPAVNVWHMWRSDEVEPDNLDQEGVARDFADNWQDHMLDLVTTDLQVIEFRWRGLSSSSSPSGTLLPDPAKQTVGGVVGQGASPQVALLVEKKTSRPRGKRDGRSYHVGVPEDAVFSGGVILAASVTSWNTQLQLFLDGTSDVGTGVTDHYPVVLEVPAEARVPGTQEVVVSHRRITGLSLDARIATQRRRNR